MESSISGILPAHWGLTGSLKNFGLIISGKDSIDEDIANQVCTGIAGATAVAINRSIKAGNTRLRKVKKAGDISRVHNFTHHTATFVEMHDTTVVVFDWHQTLLIENPMMFESTVLWKRDDKGIPFENFVGFGV
jgi:hypothetical protein